MLTPSLLTPSLLTPLQIGPVRLPNRIVFGAHPTNFGKGNRFTRQHLAYYRARSQGGAGMIVTEALTVHPLDWPYEHIPFGHGDAIVSSLEEVAETVRGAKSSTESGPGSGTVLIAQLNHWGGQGNGKLLRQSPWAPSAVPEVASRRMSREMERGQIAEVVAGFADAAARVARAGWDGVELNAGQHSLLRQFLSPLTNHRSDEYGGSPENRLRMAREVISAVHEALNGVLRGALGGGMALGLKLCGDELAPWGGLTPEDAAGIAVSLVEAGHLDYLSIQIGGPYSVHMTEAAMPVPQAHGAHLARGVREAIGAKIPVFAEGRIEAVQVAEEVISSGQADAVVMTRALVSDPELPLKAADGEGGQGGQGRHGSHGEPVRPHIGMTRYFSVVGDWNRPLSDLGNPRAGREESLPPVERRPDGGPVLVVGGGPAGMEAALTLARQGRQVTLREARAELGGMATLLAREIPARREFALLVEYYQTMLDKAGVEVRLDSPVDLTRPGLAGLSAYDTVYLATGARPEATDSALPGSEGRALSPRALLENGTASPASSPAGPESRALVVDHEYGFRMGNAVEWLLEKGWRVDILTPDFFIGRGLVESGEMLWFNRVVEGGAQFHPLLEPLSFRPGGDAGQLLCRERFSGRERAMDDVALLVVARAEIPHPEPGRLAALREGHPSRVITIGDARAPRLMGEAILHAHRTVLGE